MQYAGEGAAGAKAEWWKFGEETSKWLGAVRAENRRQKVVLGKTGLEAEAESMRDLKALLRVFSIKSR